MATAQQTQIKRHPIRGAAYGLLMGLGAAVYLVIFSVTPFSVATTIIVVAAGLVVGVVWGLFAPAKQPKDMPPSQSGASFSSSHDTNDEQPPTYETTFTAPRSAPAAPAVLRAPSPNLDDGAFGAQAAQNDNPSGEAQPPPV